MADFTSTVGPVAAQAGVVIITILAFILVFALILGLVYYVRKGKQFNRNVIILRKKQGDSITIEYDKGGYFKNKHKDWKFKLKRNKTWLEGDYRYDIKNENSGNTMMIYRDTADNFYHVDPELIFQDEYILDGKGQRIPERDPEGNILLNSENKPEYLKKAKLNIRITSEDVEWAKSAFSEYTATYSKKDMFWQYAPILSAAIFVVLVIVMFYLLLDKFGVLQSVATTLNEVSKNLLALKQSSITSVAPI